MPSSALPQRPAGRRLSDPGRTRPGRHGGVVYGAEQISLGRRVALKILPGRRRATGWFLGAVGQRLQPHPCARRSDRPTHPGSHSVAQCAPSPWHPRFVNDDVGGLRERSKMELRLRRSTPMPARIRSVGIGIIRFTVFRPPTDRGPRPHSGPPAPVAPPAGQVVGMRARESSGRSEGERPGRRPAEGIGCFRAASAPSQLNLGVEGRGPGRLAEVSTEGQPQLLAVTEH
jgi:hypothetical protein